MQPVRINIWKEGVDRSLFCFVDRMKDVIVAKLCSQCEELFSDTLKHLQRETLKGLWDRDWIPRVAAKQAGYHALAEYHQSRVSVALTLLLLTTDSH